LKKTKIVEGEMFTAKPKTLVTSDVALKIAWFFDIKDLNELTFKPQFVAS
jgi:hypothetical protein